jgi:hypothetical protein
VDQVTSLWALAFFSQRAFSVTLILMKFCAFVVNNKLSFYRHFLSTFFFFVCFIHCCMISLNIIAVLLKLLPLCRWLYVILFLSLECVQVCFLCLVAQYFCYYALFTRNGNKKWFVIKKSLFLIIFLHFLLFISTCAAHIYACIQLSSALETFFLLFEKSLFIIFSARSHQKQLCVAINLVMRYEM